MLRFAPPPVAHDHPPHPALDLARRFDRVFAALLPFIAAAYRALGRHAIPAWTRIDATRRRILSLLGRLAAGTWRPARRRPKGAAPRPGGPPAPWLPRRRAWLGIVAGHEVRACASQLQALLDAPENQALIARAPPQARAALARTLRTASRLLGVDLPSLLQPAGPPPPPPAPRPRAPRAPRPAPEPLFPPLQPYVLAAVRAWKKFTT